MRTGLAKSTALPPSKALVLGNAVVGSRIAQDLKAFDLEVETELDYAIRTGNTLPSPAQFDSAERLRQFLTEYFKGVRDVLYVHPGLSGWADRPELSVVCQELGIEVIGPSPRLLSLFGNKLHFLMEAEKAKIPHLVLSFDPVQSLREIERFITSLPDPTKFPFVLKSIRGGGAGVGVRVVHSFQEIEKALPVWLDQLRVRFGEAILFPERYVEGAHYVIQPFARFADGSTEFFPAVDASLQYRYRKLIEFCPCTTVDPEALQKVRTWTQMFADHCSYVGVGALEFLIDGPRGFLVEGLARLNAGFPLWEKVAGTSAVAWQMATLRQERPRARPLRQPMKEWASALSLRFHAEDPLLQIPQPGFVYELSSQSHWAENGNEAEIDWCVKEGSEVRPESDGLIGQLWVGSKTKQAAMKFAQEILNQIWIAGSLHTNDRFLQELLQHPWVKEGMYHASFVDEEFIPLIRPSHEILTAAVSLVRGLSQDSDSRWTASGLRIGEDKTEITWVGEPRHWIRDGMRGVSGEVSLSDSQSFRICAFPLSEDRWQVRIGTWWVPVRRWQKGALPTLNSLANGAVHSVFFRENAIVPPHDPILLVESLQTLVPHAIPVDVKILRWKIKPGDRVRLGQPLADLEKVICQPTKKP